MPTGYDHCYNAVYRPYSPSRRYSLQRVGFDVGTNLLVTDWASDPAAGGGSSWTFETSFPGLYTLAGQVHNANKRVLDGTAYQAGNCNSNWYAASLFTCTSGFPLVTAFTTLFNPRAPAFGIDGCNGRIPFSCSPPAPGFIFAYYDPTWVDPIGIP